MANDRNWTFLTNYSHVLLCIAADPAIRLKDVASAVGITERATQRIVADLVDERYLTVIKAGRRNRYRVNSEQHLRHPVEQRSQIRSLLRLIGGKLPSAGKEKPSLPKARKSS